MTDTFTQFDLVPQLAAAVQDMGFSKPTTIQAKAIPVAVTGRDVIGCASTGSGKTVAFLLPILQRLADGPRGHIRALVLSPTRELAMQIDEVATMLTWHMGLSAVSVVGGVDMGPQEYALKAGAEIVIATPGRLLDHLRYGHVNLSTVEVLVLDEADRMLDMGFLPDLKRIVELTPKTRQTLMFSATMAPPIRKLADDFLRDPEMVAVEIHKPPEQLAHRVIACGQGRKSALLTTLLRRAPMKSVLVFVNRKSDADRLARQIDRTAPAVSIHSDRSQQERSAALDAFRRGEVSILVATDVAARGIDVDGVTHVVNFDVPLSTEAYIHRGGRTARAGATGTVVTFVSPSEQIKLDAIEKDIGRKLPRAVLPGFDAGLDAPDADDPRNARRSGGGRGAPRGGPARRR
jgi:ATP-dependent RNA helicase RhlE